MSKCWGELLYITLYVATVLGFIVGIIYHAQYGKPYTILVQFSFVLLISQAKAIPVQAFVYFSVIRRFGKQPKTIDFKEWDDEQIFAGGQDLSLFSSMRKKMAEFLEHKFIS